MSAASLARHATMPAATQTANAARLLVSLAIALALHALLLSVVDWPRHTPPQTRSIDLTLTAAGTAPPTPASPPVPTTAERTNATTAATPTANQPRQATAASTPANSPQPDLSGDEQAHGAPSPLRGQRVEDLVRAVADAAGGEPTVARIVRLHEHAPKRADFAYYLQSWQRKVERIGQLNYPRQARAEGITGSLRLHVAIAADGALRDVRVLETSGHELLDEAALRIVRLAAPYAPFSPTMRETTDTLEIERTWRFLNSRFSS